MAEGVITLTKSGDLGGQFNDFTTDSISMRGTSSITLAARGIAATLSIEVSLDGINFTAMDFNEDLVIPNETDQIIIEIAGVNVKALRVVSSVNLIDIDITYARRTKGFS